LAVMIEALVVNLKDNITELREVKVELAMIIKGMRRNGDSSYLQEAEAKLQDIDQRLAKFNV
jgi:hypothetical protein